jgi:hypothetical protein
VLIINKLNADEMKNIIFFIAVLFCFESVIGQPSANKLNKTAVKLDSNSNAINNTSNAVSNTSAALNNMGKTIGGIFKSKKKEKIQTQAPAPEAGLSTEAATPTIIITIQNVDYAKLKTMKDSIKAISGVHTVDMTFNPTASSLSVGYSGKADELWDALPKRITEMYNLTKLESNSISAEFKK